MSDKGPKGEKVSGMAVLPDQESGRGAELKCCDLALEEYDAGRKH